MSLAEKGKWRKKADMPTAREVLSAAVVNGKIYAIGGWAFGRALSAVEEYDPNKWTKKTKMPTRRFALSTSAVNGKIYAIGGWIRGSLPTVEEYDPQTDTWQKKANMPTRRAALSTSVVNGKIYAIGGTPDSQAALPTVEEYNPLTDTWTRKADMPTPRISLSTSVVNGKIYAVGGWVWKGRGVTRVFSTIEAYDPQADTWTKKANMPTPRSHLSTSAVNGKIYAIGGGEGGVDRAALSTVEAYDPQTDKWTRKADMPTARKELSTSVVNGKIYAIGGWDDRPLSTVEEYTPEGWPFAVSTQGKLATTWGRIKQGR